MQRQPKLIRQCLSQRMSTLGKQFDSNKYCMNLVKQYDYENYLVGLLFPKGSRDAFFAIRAFNVELAVIKDQSNNNALAGRLRFQWWRELLEKVYSKDSMSMYEQQPVAQALAFSIQRHNLTARWFERSLEAR